MKENLYRILALLVVLTTAVGLAACGPTAAPEPTEAPAATEAAEQPTPAPTEPPTAPAEAEKVILRVGALEDNDCWNPYSCAGVWLFGHLVHEGFTDAGPASEGCPAVPRLAESWQVSDDGRTWTITLHEGISFTDGTPATAQSFVDFINWFRTSETLQPWYAESLLMESIEAVDERTIRYTTSDPLLNSPDYDWQWWYMMAPHIWTELDDSNLLTFESYPPIGTGPYMVTEHKPGNYIIFDAYEDYYMGKPPIDRVVYQIYTNADALVSALLAGEIDVTTAWLPPEVYDTLIGAENVAVEEKYPGTVYKLEFNMAAGGNKHPAIEDPAVREAIDYAIDKDQLVDVVFLGRGVTCPTNWACGPNYETELNPDLVVTPYDPEKAKQILDEAGYVDSDEDGIRETPDGEPLELRLLYQSEIGPAITTADLLTNWLSAVGISVIGEAQEYGTWTASVLDERDFDMAIHDDILDIDPASMDFWYSCWSAESGSAAYNFSGYCNEELDGLVYEYWNSTDPEGRWEPMWQAQAILNQDRPHINLGGLNSIQAYRSDRFEFPLDTCDVHFGMFGTQGLLNAKIK